jgi:hypothetical protein
MSTSQIHRDEQPTPPDQSTVVLLLGTIGDTTWRMFVPTIGLLLIGDWLDRTFNTKPILIITGIVLGSIIAGLLVRNQLRKK